MNAIKTLFLIFSSAIIFFACEDQGVSVGPTPVITSITSDSGKVGDTIIVKGIYFGLQQGTSSVIFGEKNSAEIISWTDIQIAAIVPNTISGVTSISIRMNRQQSEKKTFKVLTTSLISFINNIKPLFATYGCSNSSCHGSSLSGGLSVASVTSLLAGGIHGPAVIINNASESNLVKKLRAGTVPFGSKMPANGGNVSDTDYKLIIDWINQGALNN